MHKVFLYITIIVCVCKMFERILSSDHKLWWLKEYLFFITKHKSVDNFFVQCYLFICYGFFFFKLTKDVKLFIYFCKKLFIYLFSHVFKTFQCFLMFLMLFFRSFFNLQYKELNWKQKKSFMLYFCYGFRV